MWFRYDDLLGLVFTVSLCWFARWFVCDFGCSWKLGGLLFIVVSYVWLVCLFWIMFTFDFCVLFWFMLNFLVDLFAIWFGFGLDLLICLVYNVLTAWGWLYCLVCLFGRLVWGCWWCICLWFGCLVVCVLLLFAIDCLC